eukprot:scaffold13663_cov120-Isochrysis_galbana.AAC.3
MPDARSCGSNGLSGEPSASGASASPPHVWSIFESRRSCGVDSGIFRPPSPGLTRLSSSLTSKPPPAASIMASAWSAADAGAGHVTVRAVDVAS